jgi:hypothetical protein
MENTLRLLYRDGSVNFLGTITVHSEDNTKYRVSQQEGKV